MAGYWRVILTFGHHCKNLRSLFEYCSIKVLSVVRTCVTGSSFLDVSNKPINFVFKDWNIQAQSASCCSTSEWGEYYGKEILRILCSLKADFGTVKSWKLVYRYQRSGRALCGTFVLRINHKDLKEFPITTNTLIWICMLNGDKFRPQEWSIIRLIIQESEYTQRQNFFVGDFLITVITTV
jgi:hypothetical protein